MGETTRDLKPKFKNMHLLLSVVSVLVIGSADSVIKLSEPNLLESVIISIDEIKNETIDSKYICYTLDWGSSRDWLPGNQKHSKSNQRRIYFTENLLVDAAAELNGLLRVGGTVADRVTYRLHGNYTANEFLPLRLN